MGPKYEHFKFNLGDFVQPKILDGTTNINRKMQIVERMVQECPGGIQLHYKCRCAGMIGGVVDFLEIEIEPFEETDDEAWFETEMALRAAKRRAAREAVAKTEEPADPPSPPAES